MDDDRLAGGVATANDNGADQIDAGDQRGDAGHPVSRLGHHPILVVERRPVDPDEDVAGRQVVDRQGPDPGGGGIPGPFDHEGGEALGTRARPKGGAGGGVNSFGRHEGYRTECMRGEESQDADPGDRPTPADRFGWWPSPFAAGQVAAGKVSRSGLQADGASLFWLESRPEDGGRLVMVTDGGAGGAPVDDVTADGQHPEPGPRVQRGSGHRCRGGVVLCRPGGPAAVPVGDRRRSGPGSAHPGIGAGFVGSVRRRVAHLLGGLVALCRGAARRFRHRAPVDRGGHRRFAPGGAAGRRRRLRGRSPPVPGWHPVVLDHLEPSAHVVGRIRGVGGRSGRVARRDRHRRRPSGGRRADVSVGRRDGRATAAWW